MPSSPSCPVARVAVERHDPPLREQPAPAAGQLGRLGPASRRCRRRPSRPRWTARPCRRPRPRSRRRPAPPRRPRRAPTSRRAAAGGWWPGWPCCAHHARRPGTPLLVRWCTSMQVMTDLGEIGVVGAGFMGSGIAESAARAGARVRVHEPGAGRAGPLAGRLQKSVDRAVQRGKLSEDNGRALVERVTFHTDIEDLAPSALVVEAVFEDPRGQGADLPRAGRDPAGGRDHRVQHLVDPDRPAGDVDRAPRARDRAALLLAGAGDGAGRGRRRAGDERRRPSRRPRRSSRRSARRRSGPRTAAGSSSTCCWSRT